MKPIFPKSYLMLFIVLLISSGPAKAQDGSELITAVAYQDLDKVKIPLSLAQEERDQEMVTLLKQLGAK